MNPTIDLGFISIHYYSLFIFLGIIISVWDDIISLCLWYALCWICSFLVYFWVVFFFVFCCVAGSQMSTRTKKAALQLAEHWGHSLGGDIQVSHPLPLSSDWGPYEGPRTLHVPQPCEPALLWLPGPPLLLLLLLHQRPKSVWGPMRWLSGSCSSRAQSIFWLPGLVSWSVASNPWLLLLCNDSILCS